MTLSSTANQYSLTSLRKLISNAILNFLGQSIPLLVAIFSIPFLLHGLGTDRYGVLSLIGVFVGYFSLFDLGLGRALTKLVAEFPFSDQMDRFPALVWTAWILIFGLGTVGCGVVVIGAPHLVTSILKIPNQLHKEALHALYLLALSLPFIISGAGFRGVLEGRQYFGIVNAVNSTRGILSLVCPLTIIPFSQNLVLLAGVMITIRLAEWGILLFICLRLIPILRREIFFSLREVKKLFKFGGWMTITNIIGPLMVYLDRFLIGAVISITAVTYYTMPYDVITRLWLIPGALVSALFPALAAAYSQDQYHARKLFIKAVKYVFLTLFPITLLIVSFAHEGLSLWLGKAFAEHSTKVLQWLALGVFINSLAQVPFALIQGAGRPDLTAKLHILELFPYLLALWWLMHILGIEGAAIAWSLRTTLDSALLFLLSKKFLPTDKKLIFYSVFGICTSLILFLSIIAIGELPLRIAAFTITLLFSIAVTFKFLIAEEEKNFFKVRWTYFKAIYLKQ